MQYETTMNNYQKIILGTGFFILGLMVLFVPAKDIRISQDASGVIHADNATQYQLLFTVPSAKEILFTQLLIQCAIVIIITFLLTILLKTHKHPKQNSQTRIAKQHPIDEIVYKDE